MRYFNRITFIIFVHLACVAPRPQTTRPAQPTMPPGSRFLPDLAYVDHGHDRQKLDLYLPVEAKDHCVPVVVYIHGGGWREGDRRNPPARVLLSRGYAVASVEHRFSNDAIFPAQINDVKAAVRWLRAHASEYSLDPNHFAAWGASSGGQLAVMLGMTGDLKELEGDGGNLDQSSRVQCVIDYYGTIEFRKPKEFPLNPNREKLLGGTSEQKPELAALATPITHATPDDAPVFIVHGDADPIVTISHSEVLEAALKQAHVEVKFVRIPNALHGGPEFLTNEMFDEVGRFLDEHLKSGK